MLNKKRAVSNMILVLLKIFSHYSVSELLLSEDELLLSLGKVETEVESSDWATPSLRAAFFFMSRINL